MKIKEEEVKVTIKLMELEKLRQNMHSPRDCAEAWQKLLAIGEENLEEKGLELIKRVKMLRGINDEDICEMCDIRKDYLENILMERSKITKAIAAKLSKLGYPVKAFIV